MGQAQEAWWVWRLLVFDAIQLRDDNIDDVWNGRC